MSDLFDAPTSVSLDRQIEAVERELRRRQQPAPANL